MVEREDSIQQAQIASENLNICFSGFWRHQNCLQNFLRLSPTWKRLKNASKVFTSHFAKLCAPAVDRQQRWLCTLVLWKWSNTHYRISDRTGRWLPNRTVS